jgi:propanol-preferring alcohol dehydrogenase
MALMCSSSNRAYTQAPGFLGFRGALCCIGVPEGENYPFGTTPMGSMLQNGSTIFGKSYLSHLANIY